MAKGMCIIKINEDKKYTAISFIYYYLVWVGSGIPGYVNSLSPPMPGGMHGGGVHGSVACDKNFARYPPLG